jgi:hypothetical protein
VQESGNGYVCLAANTATGNNNPTSGGSASTYWSLLVQRGSQGSQGSASTAAGVQGTQGSLGPTGATGADGARGSQGSQGTQGSLGPTGATGAQGSQGTQGTQGTQGSLGPTGATGPQGSQGSQGSAGATGYVSPRVTATASTLTPGPNADTDDLFALTAQAGTAAFSVANGTPVDGQKMIIRITATGSTRNITWADATGGWTAGGVALPLTAAASKTVHIGFIYDTGNNFNRWMCVASSTQI